MELGRYENFSLFIPRHRRLAGHLIRIFIGEIYMTCPDIFPRRDAFDIFPRIFFIYTSKSRYYKFRTTNCLPDILWAPSHVPSFFPGLRTVEDLKTVAVYARDRINPYMFNYCLSVALLHRPDTQSYDVPSFMQTFPDKFVDGTVLQRAVEETSLVREGNRVRNFFKGTGTLLILLFLY